MKIRQRKTVVKLSCNEKLRFKGSTFQPCRFFFLAHHSVSLNTLVIQLTHGGRGSITKQLVSWRQSFSVKSGQLCGLIVGPPSSRKSHLLLPVDQNVSICTALKQKSCGQSRSKEAEHPPSPFFFFIWHSVSTMVGTRKEFFISFHYCLYNSSAGQKRWG